jgi:hypothetical protein
MSSKLQMRFQTNHLNHSSCPSGGVSLIPEGFDGGIA